MPIIITPKKIKHLGRHLTKHIQNLNEHADGRNQRRSKIERQTVFMDWKTIPIVKMTIFPKLIYRFNETPIKILAKVFCSY